MYTPLKSVTEHQNWHPACKNLFLEIFRMKYIVE